MHAVILKAGTSTKTGESHFEVAFWPDRAAFDLGTKPVCIESFDVELRPTAKAVATDANGNLILADGSTITPEDRQREVDEAAAIYRAAKDEFNAGKLDEKSFLQAKADYAAVTGREFQTVTVERDNEAFLNRVFQSWWNTHGNANPPDDWRDKSHAIDEQADPKGVFATDSGQRIKTSVDTATRAKWVDAKPIDQPIREKA